MIQITIMIGKFKFEEEASERILTSLSPFQRSMKNSSQAIIIQSLSFFHNLLFFSDSFLLFLQRFHSFFLILLIKAMSPFALLVLMSAKIVYFFRKLVKYM